MVSVNHTTHSLSFSIAFTRSVPYKTFIIFICDIALACYINRSFGMDTNIFHSNHFILIFVYL